MHCKHLLELEQLLSGSTFTFRWVCLILLRIFMNFIIHSRIVENSLKFKMTISFLLTLLGIEWTYQCSSSNWTRQDSLCHSLQMWHKHSLALYVGNSLQHPIQTLVHKPYWRRPMDCLKFCHYNNLIITDKLHIRSPNDSLNTKLCWFLRMTHNGMVHASTGLQ